MKATDIITVATQLIEQKLPLFIWGAPGIGKSSIVKEIARAEGLEFLDLRLSLLDPTDLKGIPFFDPQREEGVWAKPSFLPSDPMSRGVLFLDEINTAPPAVQASAYQLILDRRVGEYTLPEGWSIVAAGNRESDRGVVYKMPPPLANRFVHFEMEVDFEEWKQWAYARGVQSSIIAYLAYDTAMLFTFDPLANQKSFATPRSWEYVDRLMDSKIPESLLLETLTGAVGREGAIGYLSFRKVMDQLPNLTDVIEGRIEGVESDDPKVLMALVIGVVNQLRDHPSDEAIDHLLRFSLRLPGEFAIMLVKDMQLSGIGVEGSSEWGVWVKQFAYLLR